MDQKGTFRHLTVFLGKKAKISDFLAKYRKNKDMHNNDMYITESKSHYLNRMSQREKKSEKVKIDSEKYACRHLPMRF